MSSSDLAAEIAEYCINVERKPVKRLELIQNIMRDAQVTKQWPTATVKRWEAAIAEAEKLGLLVRASETIWIPKVIPDAKVKQMGLFE